MPLYDTVSVRPSGIGFKSLKRSVCNSMTYFFELNGLKKTLSNFAIILPLDYSALMKSSIFSKLVLFRPLIFKTEMLIYLSKANLKIKTVGRKIIHLIDPEFWKTLVGGMFRN